MEKQPMIDLVAKYNEGLADPAEIRQLEQLIESGEVQLIQLHNLEKLDEQLIRMESPAPSIALDDKFYAQLAEEKRKAARGKFSFAFPDLNFLVPRLALTLALVIIGFAGGYYFRQPSSSLEVHVLTQQVSDLKEMMLLSLLEKESASDRIKAVNLSTEMNQVSKKVTSALIKTLNEDENVNVRLAALEAITFYSKDSQVREALIQSISRQNSPLVQMALAEVMVSIQEKKSVKELQKLMQNEKTPKEVKSKIQESINVLI